MNGDIVMDFFAGSGTVAEAILNLNAKEGGNRRIFLVQIPEPTDQAAYPTIAEVCKERFRRAGKKVKEDFVEYKGDVGFRVFKLDTSSVRAWNSRPDRIEDALLHGLDHIDSCRTHQDILYELLLKFGLGLCVPIETQTIAGKSVFSIGAGTLMVCIDEVISKEHLETVALGIADWRDALAPAGETCVVFRDSAFEDDLVKTNLTAILEQRGISNVRSL